MPSLLEPELLELADERELEGGLRVRRLKFLPRQLLVPLVDISPLGGQRIGDLDNGVIPVEPDTVSFDVKVAKLSKKWYDAACPSLLLALSLSRC